MQIFIKKTGKLSSSVPKVSDGKREKLKLKEKTQEGLEIARSTVPVGHNRSLSIWQCQRTRHKKKERGKKKKYCLAKLYRPQNINRQSHLIFLVPHHPRGRARQGRGPFPFTPLVVRFSPPSPLRPRHPDRPCSAPPIPWPRARWSRNPLDQRDDIIFRLW